MKHALSIIEGDKDFANIGNTFCLKHAEQGIVICISLCHVLLIKYAVANQYQR